MVRHCQSSKNILRSYAVATATPKTEEAPKNIKVQDLPLIVLTAGAKRALEALRNSSKDGHVAASEVANLSDHIAELRAAGAVLQEGSRRGAKYRAVPASRISSETRGPRKKTTAPSKARNSRLQATPEEMNRLLLAIQKEEVKVNDTTSAANDKKIADLQKRLATAKGDDLTLAFQEMAAAMEERRTLTTQVRKAAFQNIEAEAIPQAKYLVLLKAD
jgi:hypothetical protein